MAKNKKESIIKKVKVKLTMTFEEDMRKALNTPLPKKDKKSEIGS